MENRRGSGTYLMIIVVMFLYSGIVIGLSNNLYSLYLIPITTEFGIGRSAFISAQSVRYLAAALSNVLFAKVYERFGYHRVVGALCAVVGLAYVGYGLAQNMLPLYIGSLLYGLGESFIYSAGISKLVSNWFNSRRGSAMGIIMAATGLGGALLTLILTRIMTAFGWRNAMFFSAALMLVISIAMFALIRDTPAERGLQPYYRHEPDGRHIRVNRVWTGIDPKIMMKQKFFFLSVIAVFISALCTSGTYSTVVAHFQDQGLSQIEASNCFSIMLFGLAGAKIVVGAINDRFGAHSAMYLCYACILLGLITLATTRTVPQAVLCVLLLSVAFCTNGSTQPLVALELFGDKGAATALGIMMALYSVGGVVASPMVQLAYDLIGSYTPILLILCGAAIISLILYLIAYRGAVAYRKGMVERGEIEA